jgi:tetratricopeptide (TPR) repeat protein
LPPKDGWWFWYHSAIGMIYTRQNDPIKAIPYLKKGLEMTETQSIPGKYTGLAYVYLDIGDYETAEEYLSKSLELEVSCKAIAQYRLLMQAQGKFKEALQFIDSTCHQGECEWVCTRALFQTSWMLGDFEKAEQYWDQWQNPGRIIVYEIGDVYDQLGRKEDAGETFTTEIRRLESKVKEDHITYLHLSRIYAFKGNRVEALKYLAEYAKRGFTQGWHDFILIDPFFESLRDDPEFKAIVRQAQEEKAALREQVRQMEARGETNL